MKKKKISKLVKMVVTESNNLRYDQLSVKKSYDNDSNSPSSNDEIFTTSDDQTKKKIRNLIIRLLHHRDEIHFNSNERTLNLNSRMEEKIRSTSTKSSYFNLEVIKDVGFIINCNDKRTHIQDTLLYDEIKPQIKQIFDKVNLENFNGVYSSIMKDSGLSRESNLDDLLSDF